MIPFKPSEEPEGFDQECRRPGNAWLASNPGARRPRDFWSPFKPRLAKVFRQLCGYSAMFEPVGTVDHYRGVAKSPELIYEWSNYRFASAWINSSKRSADKEVLDPFEIEEGWFEILLPSLQLVATERVPVELRDKARHTLERLHLRDDERVIRQRRVWLQLYEEGKLSLEGLWEMAPLIARAVEQDQRQGRS
jgi:hypothetical protein